MTFLCLAALALSEYTVELPKKPCESQRLAARELVEALECATEQKTVDNGKLRFVLARGPEGAERPSAFASLSERRGTFTGMPPMRQVTVVWHTPNGEVRMAPCSCGTEGFSLACAADVK